MGVLLAANADTAMIHAFHHAIQELFTLMQAGGQAAMSSEQGLSTLIQQVMSRRRALFENSWVPAAPMRQPRCGFAATALRSGQVVVAGGLRWRFQTPDEDDLDEDAAPPTVEAYAVALDIITEIKSAELFDPRSDTWTELPDLPMGGELDGWLLPDGRFAVRERAGSPRAWATSDSAVYALSLSLDSWEVVCGPEFLDRECCAAFPACGGHVVAAGTTNLSYRRAAGYEYWFEDAEGEVVCESRENISEMTEAARRSRMIHAMLNPGESAADWVCFGDDELRDELDDDGNPKFWCDSCNTWTRECECIPEGKPRLDAELWDEETGSVFRLPHDIPDSVTKDGGYARPMRKTLAYTVTRAVL
jgi:hypothetical protein